ncbi:MAG: urate hydroxylase PuuD [Chloroflexi bacterium]|nr:urate hydroxylase PuuD [Chloroflexota bacterium]MBI2983589.1 urate hydroxylase PuuD [Chloroflexota bacterium]
MAPEVLLVTRWVHFVAGITWIGLLYWFNFINVRTMATIDATARPHVVTTLLPRALAWFRHSAWVTVLAGFVLIYGTYWANGNVFGTAGARTIFFGMTLGVIMLLNVWGIIWPNQKRIIATARAGGKADPIWGRNALYASRTNFALSFPMLFFMAGASHAELSDQALGIAFIVLAGLGFATVMAVQKWWSVRF